MGQQLGLDLEPEQPKRRRAGRLRSFHARGHVPPAEALAGEARASGQDDRVLRVFRETPRSERLTPSQVRAALVLELGQAAPLLTSVRRSLTNLTRSGALVHHREDRRPGPHGATESTWALA